MTKWAHAARPVVTAALLLLTITLAGLSRCEDRPVEPDTTKLFTGKVVDGETSAPVKGASLVVERLLVGVPSCDRPAWASEQTLKTDDDGRFVVKFPAEQVAERRLAISIHVAHPDYIRCKSTTAFSLVEMLLGRQAGEKPFFDTIKLSKGIQYSGQIETPDGKPASGVPFEIAPFGVDSSSSENFVDDGKGKTDSDGRFRLRMPRSQQIAFYVTPHEHAPFQRFFGVDEPEKHPDSWVSGNFGRLVLAPGIRLSGRLIDLNGRPVAGQLITAISIYGQHGRTATTDAHGEFTFAPLRQGNYVIFGEGQRPGSGIDLATPSARGRGPYSSPPKST